MAIIDEARENLTYFIDLDEYKLFKNLLRMMGEKGSDEEAQDLPNGMSIDRKGAYLSGGTTVRTEV